MGWITALIPAPYRWLAMALMLVAALGIGFMRGVVYEGNSRDAAAYKQTLASDAAFQRALERGTAAAKAAIEARTEAETLRRKLRERINDAKDSELITGPDCSEPQPHGEMVARSFLFSGLFIRLYNDAWEGGYEMPADTGGALTAPSDTGTVDAKDILLNTETNAGACAADRDRQNRLIDLLETRTHD